MSFFEDFTQRGFVRQMTDPSLPERLDTQRFVFYVGYDPTASSLHVGHFLALMAMRRMQQGGHKPIVILGGGTAMIGDPTGKMELRRMLSRDDINHNGEALKDQFRRFLTFGEGDTDAVMLNNADWLCSLNYLDFLREYGVHFSVNRMLTYESVKLRLEKGLTFLEFNYNLLQSFDFLQLYRSHGCTLQLGGDDQWANITAGIDLIRRLHGAEAYGLTIPLITTSSGAKMGKTEKGAVWLDPALTSPYDFYQYWINVEDGDVGRFMRLLTDLPLDEISRYEALKNEDVREAKKALAYAVTSLVHGAQEADAAANAAGAAFSKEREITPADEVPSAPLSRARLDAGEALAALLAEVGVTSSRGEARRLIQGGGVILNGVKVVSLDQKVGPEHLDRWNQVIVRLGKKRWFRFIVS